MNQSELSQREKDYFDQTNRVNTAIYKREFTTDRDVYYPWDVEGWSATTDSTIPVAIEIKIRKEQQSYFERYAPYLERKKLVRMLVQQQEVLLRKGFTVKLFYLNITGDRVAQLFELKTEEAYRWSWKLLPKSQEDRTKVWKEVALLTQPYQTFFI